MKMDAKTAPQGSVRDWIDHQADTQPDAVSHIFLDTGTQLTWAEMRQSAAEIAAHLAGMGVAKGASVGLCCPNGEWGIRGLFGILYGGFRATALNLAAGPAALGYALDHSEAEFVLVARSKSDVFEAACADLENPPTPIWADAEIEWPTDTRAPLPEVTATDDALLMYTSGTTGKPKGVIHSQSSLLAGGWTPTVAHKLTPADRAYCVLPFFHINGLCVTLMGPLVSGGSVIVTEKFSNSRFWTECAEHKATWFSVVPTIISHLLHSDHAPDPATKARIRFGRSASAPLAPEIQSAFEEKFDVPIVETMGLTETAAQILSNPLPPGLRKIGSPGKAYGNDCAILLPDGSTASALETGEIAVRGPNVMSHYLKNPEATEGTFNSDGWLLTGDLGHMDDDGYVFVTGRLKELIIKGGENIAPREVDEALYANGDVVEAAAFARPCDSYGQRVEAAVSVVEGSSVTEADLIAGCHARLGPFKSPDKVYFLPDLPKGPSGKIQRLKLVEMFG